MIAKILIFYLQITLILSQQCKYFTHYHNDYLFNPCASVINYAYFLPININDAYLEEKVKTSLNNYKLKNTPVLCQEALRNYTCSLVYQKCFPGVVIGDKTTYDPNIYKPYSLANANLKLPILRPCQLVCTEVHAQCSGSLYLLANKLPDCNVKRDFTDGVFTLMIPTLFDVDNNHPIKCYLPSSDSNSQIASSNELYTGEVCKGFVDRLYVPTGYALNTTYTTLIPTGYFQEIVENKLKTSILSLPNWMSRSCMFALHQYFCLSSFKYPQIKSLIEVILENNYDLTFFENDPKINSMLGNVTLTMPSYLSYDNCIYYETQCEAFITKANKALLIPNCSKLSTQENGIVVKAYPKENQTVSTFHTVISNLGNVALNVTSIPNKASSYDIDAYSSVYSTQCPHGYTVPDENTYDQSLCVPGTGCAMKCKLAWYTDDEWDFYETLLKALPLASIIMGGTTILALITTQKLVHVTTAVLLLLLTWISSMFSTIYFTNYSFIERHCRNEYDVIYQSDGASNCVAHGVIVTIVVLASACITFILACETFYEITYAKKLMMSYWYRPLQIFLCIALPCIPLIYALSQEYMGYKRGNFTCGITTYANLGQPKNLVGDSTGKPLLIVVLLQAGIILITLQQVLLPCQESSNSYLQRVAPSGNKKHSDDDYDDEEDDYDYYEANYDKPNTNTNNEAIPDLNKPDFEDKWFTYTNLLFLTLMLGLWIPYGIRQMIVTRYIDRYPASFQTWSTCLFQHFESTSNTTYLDICGSHSPDRPPYILNIFLIIVNFSNCLLPGFVYLTSITIKYFYTNKNKTSSLIKQEEEGTISLQESGQNLNKSDLVEQYTTEENNDKKINEKINQHSYSNTKHNDDQPLPKQQQQQQQYDDSNYNNTFTTTISTTSTSHNHSNHKNNNTKPTNKHNNNSNNNNNNKRSNITQDQDDLELMDF